MLLFFKFVCSQVEECFASSEKGGGRLGEKVGKKQNNALILSKVTLAFQELKEQETNTYSYPIPLMDIFCRSLYDANLLRLNTGLDVWRVVLTPGLSRSVCVDWFSEV